MWRGGGRAIKNSGRIYDSKKRTPRSAGTEKIWAVTASNPNRIQPKENPPKRTLKRPPIHPEKKEKFTRSNKVRPRGLGRGSTTYYGGREKCLVPRESRGADGEVK